MRNPAGDPHEIALLCNPRAGGRWRVLADVLDSDEAKGAHRSVTDDIVAVREAIAGLGQRVRLLCIYGGDGTIYRVINELLRDPAAPVPRLAFLGGGTMNVTAAWCGMRGSPGENFRQLVRGYRTDRLLWREVPVLAVKQKHETRHGFTFGLGPIVRILERYEAGQKSRLKAVEIAAKSALGALAGVPRDFQPTLKPLEAKVDADDQRLPYDRFAAVFANVTGTVNPFVEPFLSDRTRDSFHFLAYAVSPREFAMTVPLLLRGIVPIDPGALLHPVSTWRQLLLALVGKAGLPTDPRYINHPAKKLVIETAEPVYTIDGEILRSSDRGFEIELGRALDVATLPARPARGWRGEPALA